MVLSWQKLSIKIRFFEFLFCKLFAKKGHVKLSKNQAWSSLKVLPIQSYQKTTIFSTWLSCVSLLDWNMGRSDLDPFCCFRRFIVRLLHYQIHWRELRLSHWVSAFLLPTALKTSKTHVTNKMTVISVSVDTYVVTFPIWAWNAFICFCL